MMTKRPLCIAICWLTSNTWKSFQKNEELVVFCPLGKIFSKFTSTALLKAWIMFLQYKVKMQTGGQKKCLFQSDERRYYFKTTFLFIKKVFSCPKAKKKEARDGIFRKIIYIFQVWFNLFWWKNKIWIFIHCQGTLYILFFLPKICS